MRDLAATVSTNEIHFNEEVTREKLSIKLDDDWNDPSFFSVFDANFDAEHFSVTAHIPMEHNLVFHENWQHVLVRPDAKDTPSYDVMSKIATAFFKEEANEYAMQVIPKRENYVSREEYTLHLWNLPAKAPDFQIDEALQKAISHYIGNTFYVSYDSLGNKFISIISETNWPSWTEIVQTKEWIFGTDSDAILINRGFEKDIQAFEGKLKVVLIWEASRVQLPPSFLV